MKPDIQAFDVATAPEWVSGHQELLIGLLTYLARGGKLWP
jgi:hypothetical protein